MKAIESPDEGHGWALYTHPSTTLGQIDPFVADDVHTVYGSVASCARLARLRFETPHHTWLVAVADLLWHADDAFNEDPREAPTP